jgi:hypothetical protein
MYSGHTAGITLCVLMWTHYSKGEEWKVCCGDRRPYLTPNLDAVGDPATCSLTAVLAWAFAATGFFFIIATHFHYSNDVFIGLIITQFGTPAHDKSPSETEALDDMVGMF